MTLFHKKRKSVLLHKEDQKFLRELQEEGSVLSKDDKEYLLHLFDKLWENIIHKENRLWTFLSLYGAAVGIAIGTGVAQTFKLETGFVLLILTYWAVEIIIDADWWSVRNRLMVRGIERRVSEAVKGVTPSFYTSPKYAGDPIHNISILVFALIGITVFGLSIGIFETGSQAKAKSLQEFIGITIFYGISAFALVRCAHHHEKRIAEYYVTFRDLNEQEKAANRVGVDAIPDEKWMLNEDTDRKSLTWRLPVLSLYFIVTLMIGVRYFETVQLWPFVIFCLAQGGVIVIFIFQWIRYKRGDQASGKEKVSGFHLSLPSRQGESFTMWNFLLVLAFVISVAVPLVGAFFTELTWLPVSADVDTRIGELRGQLGKLETEIEAVDNFQKTQWENRFLSRQEGSEIISTLTRLEGELDGLAQDLSEATGNTKTSQLEIEAFRQGLEDLQKRLDSLETK